nr:hypothetical protein [Candidatus Sigynarchaeota archaeon]
MVVVYLRFSLNPAKRDKNAIPRAGILHGCLASRFLLCGPNSWRNLWNLLGVRETIAGTRCAGQPFPAGFNAVPGKA